MIYYKTEEEIDIIKEGADILGRAHGLIAQAIKPGIKTIELDKIAFDFITESGGKPSFKGYNGFPSTLCISVNDQVVHGFPSNYELKEGDIISVDCGVFWKGFHSDSAYTYPVGKVSDEVSNLLKATKQSLYLGIENAIEGNRIGDISFAIQSYVEGFGYGVVRELVGHGIGQNLHESPEVPNYGKKGTGLKLQEGLVIAIEPMINMGKKAIIQENDGWTIRTADNLPSAHFEHTITIGKDKADILSSFDYIDEVVNKK